MEVAAAFLYNLRMFVVIAAIACAIGFVLERIAPAERGQRPQRIAFNLVAGGCMAVVSCALVALLEPLIAPATTPPVGQRISIEMPDGVAGSIAQILVFLFFYDFLYYWWHRAQHELAWLWPQHALHHSDTALNVSTSLRHHWLENPIRVFVQALPLGFLFYFKPASVPIVAAAFALWAFFIHMNVRLELGWLTPVVVGPQYHRVHHSVRKEHVDHNYAAVFPLWDILFGTAYLPARGEFPPTGIERGEPSGLVEALTSPFGDWTAMARARLPANVFPRRRA